MMDLGKDIIYFKYPSCSNVVYSKSIGRLVLKRNRSCNTKNQFKAVMVISILQALRAFLSEGKTVTKRELFYHLSNKFKKQAILDDMLHDIAIKLNCSIQSLNIVSGTRGSIIGNMILRPRGRILNVICQQKIYVTETSYHVELNLLC
jgi:DNA topoisomerase VI subunit A